MRDEKELTQRELNRLATDALVLAAAVKLYAPQAQKRVHKAADRVLRLLTTPPVEEP